MNNFDVMVIVPLHHGPAKVTEVAVRDLVTCLKIRCKVNNKTSLHKAKQRCISQLLLNQTYGIKEKK